MATSRVQHSRMETDTTIDTPIPPTSSDPIEAPQGRDPRLDFADISVAVGRLVASPEPADLSRPTVCPDFTVEILLDHIVMVMRRIGAVGAGEHFSTVEQVPLGQGWAAAYDDAADRISAVWADDAVLGRTIEVPWGSFPGAAVMAAYCTEIAVHGWDLAQATDRRLEIADEALIGTLAAARFISADGRESDEIPFGPVIDPGPEASLLDQIAGWLGRPVAV